MDGRVLQRGSKEAGEQEEIVNNQQAINGRPQSESRLEATSGETGWRRMP